MTLRTFDGTGVGTGFAGAGFCRKVAKGGDP
jgi:hypothetical protein